MAFRGRGGGRGGFGRGYSKEEPFVPFPVSLCFYSFGFWHQVAKRQLILYLEFPLI